MQAEVEAEAPTLKLWRREKVRFQFMRPVFKIVGCGENTLLVNRPDNHKVMMLDDKLDEMQSFTFTSKPQSICAVTQPSEQPPKEMFVGCVDGSIVRVDLATGNQISTAAHHQSESYVNDIVAMDNCLVNCYNCGTIRVWERNIMAEKITMKSVHSSYVYKLRINDKRLFSCGHDKRVVLTDMTVCEPVRGFTHPDSVWGIHCLSYCELASVGLSGLGTIWDVRSGRVSQSWSLPGNESSFVTELEPNVLVMGDGTFIKTYDRRNEKVQTKGYMLVSTEALYKLNENRLVAAGRGGDIAIHRLDLLFDLQFQNNGFPGLNFEGQDENQDDEQVEQEQQDDDMGAEDDDQDYEDDEDDIY